MFGFSADFPALVVKASGLAAGKGVIVAENQEAACQAARDMLDGQKFGSAGQAIVVEELLCGKEISVSVMLFSICLFLPLFLLSFLPPLDPHTNSFGKED